MKNLNKKAARVLSSKLKNINILNSKHSFEFSFAWMFAILAGATILFLAVYFSAKLIATSEYEQNTITAKQLSIIFEPLETGLMSGKSNIARLNEETRIYNDCKEDGVFGRNEIKLSAKSLGKFSKPGAPIKIVNKYIFSSELEEGKEIYFFSKPFEMPWKVSEIIFLTTENYCFANAPDFISEEVAGLNLQNIKLENCTDEIKVCFGYEKDCEISVQGMCSDYTCESDYDYGFVNKKGEKLFYEGSLIYAGIFSSRQIYDCNVKRLAGRIVQEALIYKDEAEFLAGKCSFSSNSLVELVNSARNMKDNEDLLVIRQMAKEADEANKASECRLW